MNTRTLAIIALVLVVIVILILVPLTITLSRLPSGVRLIGQRDQSGRRWRRDQPQGGRGFAIQTGRVVRAGRPGPPPRYGW